MTPIERSKAMNWFNVRRGEWPLKACYNFVESSHMPLVNTRERFERLWKQEGLEFPHYRKDKDYIFIWGLGPPEKPYEKSELIEITEFLANYIRRMDPFAEKASLI